MNTNGATTAAATTISAPRRRMVDVTKRAPRAAQEATKASSRPTKGGVVVPTLAMWNHAARIGGALTPAQIANIIREGDTGDTRRLMDLANECRQADCHLQAVLGTHEESIAGLAWQIIPPTAPGRDKPRGRDKRAAQWCEEQLRNNPGLQRLIADLSGAYYYSFAVVEIVWRKDAGKLVPERFSHVAPRRFVFRREDGMLVLADSGADQVDFRNDHPNKFIVCQPRVNGDVPNREGLARPLIWMSVMRRWAIGDWIHTGEMSWKPWRIGTYKQDKAGSKDREDLETILRRMTTDFTAVISDAMDIKVEWPGGASTRGGTHAEIVNVLGQEMSKAVLGHLETQTSSLSGNTDAKAKDGVRKELRETRARVIAADITRDLITPMIRLNYGESVEVPRFEFVTTDALDLKAFSESLVNFRTAGARIPEAWAHEQAGIPTPKEGERLLGDGEPAMGGDPGANTPATPAVTPPDDATPPAADEPAPPEPPAPTKAERRAMLFADVKGARDAGLVVTQDDIERLADEYDVEPPQLATMAPLVIEPSEPSHFEKAAHQARQSAALLADIREAKALGAPLSQEQINETAARYGVPTVELERCR